MRDAPWGRAMRHVAECDPGRGLSETAPRKTRRDPHEARRLQRQPWMSRATATRPEPPADPGTTRTGAPSRRFRILVAEDDVAMRCVVADALRDDGHDVV